MTDFRQLESREAMNAISAVINLPSGELTVFLTGSLSTGEDLMQHVHITHLDRVIL